ncbi:MAG: aspartate/glutamate racemase family protein [Rhodospirillaceae bacterium]
MIGVFDSGFGGLTIHEALIRRLPNLSFLYLGDRRNAPYGSRGSEEILEFTRTNIDRLFTAGCRLAIIACNTASAVALHNLQQYWLRDAWPGRNVLGIVVPTIEAATQVPWAINHPVYPQMYNDATIAVFATLRTVDSGTYPVEINKRCPQVEVIQEACPELAGLIEIGAAPARLREVVVGHVEALLGRMGGRMPEAAILGCTHYPLVKDLFRQALPSHVRLLCQPGAVANSLEHYLLRHPEYLVDMPVVPRCLFLTTGDAEVVTERSRDFLGREIPFQAFDGQPVHSLPVASIAVCEMMPLCEVET